MKKTVNLVSGGIDSYLAYKLIEGIPVFVNYGQKYADKEFDACSNLYGDKLNVIKLNNNNINCIEIDNNYIPNRNLTLISLVVNYYYPDRIIMAGMKDDNCLDKSETAFRYFREIISKYSKKDIHIYSPFWYTTKGKAIENYLNKGYDPEILKQTISCYSSSINKCGDCEACFRWVVALESNGVSTELKLSNRIIKKYMNDIDNYGTDRRNRIVEYFKRNNYEL